MTAFPFQKDLSVKKRVSYGISGLLTLVGFLILLFGFSAKILTYVQGSDLTLIHLSDAMENGSSVLLILLLSYAALCVVGFVLFSVAAIAFFRGQKSYAAHAQTSVFFNLFLTLALALASYVIAFLDTNSGFRVIYSGAGLFVAELVTVILHSLTNLLFDWEQETSSRGKGRWAKVGLQAVCLVLLVGLCVLTAVACTSDIAHLTFSNDTLQTEMNINGWELLNGTVNTLAFEVLHFFLFAGLMVCGLSAVLTVSAVCSRSPSLKSMGVISVTLNLLAVLAVALFGKYYEIGLNINLEKIMQMYADLGLPDLGETYSVTVESKAFYLLIGQALLSCLALILRPFSRLAGPETVVAAPAQNDSFDQNGAHKAEEIPEDPFLPTEPDLPPPTVLPGEENFDNCPAFTEIDRERGALQRVYLANKERTMQNPSLPALVKHVVRYAAESRNHLSYTEEDIASFVAGLAMGRLSILQGLSGTGKTSLPKIFMEALGGRCEIVEVESSWKDKNELLGYYNEFSRVYSPKKFTQALYRAVLTPEVPVFIVLDEMNLSRIEYYFSDFLSLMENDEDKRFIRLLDRRIFRTEDGESHAYAGLYRDNTIRVPANVWFVGTANRDESTFEISDKVYDRANTLNFEKRAPKAAFTGEAMAPAFVPVSVLRQLLEEAEASMRCDIEANSLVADVEKLLAPYNIAFGNRVLRQMEIFVKVYSACFENKAAKMDEALEKILLSKIIHKLEFKNLRDKDELVRELEKRRLYACSEFVSRLGGDSFYD